jgi:DNA-binding transcriptional LysR family regulator
LKKHPFAGAGPAQPLPPWAHVQALAVLAQAGSYTAAALRLGVSKAAMSQRIAELEAAAGVPLVRRTTRSVRLTEAGLALATASQPAFERIAQAFSQVQAQANGPAGLLRITAPVALARQQLVPRLPAFLRRYPAVRLELDLSDRLSALAAEGFDLALRHTHTPPDTHVAWPLCATQAVLVASPAYLAQQPVPQHPATLSGHQCLYYPRPGEPPGWSFEPAGPLAPERAPGERMTVGVAGPLAANNSEALREAAEAGLGIALLPDFSAQAALAEGRLLQVLPSWQPVGAFGSHVWAIRPRTAQVPPAVQALVSYLREAWAGGFPVPAKKNDPTLAGGSLQVLQ